MAIYVGDTGFGLPIELTTSESVTRLVVSYSPDGITNVTWELTPTGSSGGVVSFLRVAQAGDFPIATRGGYQMRATAYAADNVVIFKTDKVLGPPVEP